MDRGVIATASELFGARHFPGVIAVASDALESEPDCVPLLVLRARAHIALRRDLDAQADLRDIIRIEPQHGIAYRLLGVLAARRDENESAAIFFREALRLDPDDTEAADWLQIVDASIRPAQAFRRAPTAASPARASTVRGSTPRAHEPGHRTLSSPARPATSPGTGPAVPPRFARGTHTAAPSDAAAAELGEERPTKPFARGSERDGEVWKTPAPALRERTLDLDGAAVSAAVPPGIPGPRAPNTPPPLPPPPSHARLVPPGRGPEPAPILRLAARPATLPPPAPPLARTPPRPAVRPPVPELPGFGEYLVSAGILTRERLRAAQAYQRSMKVHLSTAIVTLGLATPQRIEWAAVAHQSQLARERPPVSG